MALPKDWALAIQKQGLQLPYQAIIARLNEERASGKVIYPPQHLLFNALTLTPFSSVKVVILGQDPYHDEGQAHGLAFSVPKGVKCPPSLHNIFKELAQDLSVLNSSGDLSNWAQQGVLLLNTSLSVEAHQPLSHAHYGWQDITDAIIQTLASQRSHLVFMLWGKYAQAKTKLINPDNKHLILKAPHPSPLSAHRGFLGCKHFSQANQFLESKGQTPINWKT